MCGGAAARRLVSMSTPTLTPAAVSTATAGLSFPLLLRAQPGHRWWRPLLVGSVAVVLYAAFLLALGLGAAVVAVVVPAVGGAVDRFWSTEVDSGDPVTFGLLLAMVALMLPALLVATRLVGSGPVGVLSSVTGRLRLRWFGSATLVALALWVPTMTVWFVVSVATGNLEVRQVAPSTSLVLLVLTLVLVPFQAAAEEYVFRGHLVQLAGSWLRHPAVAVLLPVPLFVVGHGYGFLGTVDVAVFALVCGWLAWRTGGLEAPIAVHVANNAVLMVASAVGLGDPNATDTSVLGLVISTALLVVFALVVVRRADALGVVRTAASAGSATMPLRTHGAGDVEPVR